ncbi:tRNA1(Val) (adenine(37)-N6)-methyltransferase [Macrococcoides caseolyticum]|uniref:tRNA1(Val) (adenine(37)-N6)-methyltransferase n=1 Tax=Macrococcoides caseolyticum TaxID=69966 RepID=UPI001F30079F|nr:tRNA1(Val) (adenine(37)-N6)-methyltransferase [Macrococcus caseolyticus]MCE4957931.1 tRNA1(Val) (adenine(37)-N6)-methyltransferase [Macrococcus caseolyticus]
MLLENERLDLLIKESLSIIQNDDVFSFSTDALLLAHFTSLRRSDKVMDICSGNGIIPLLLSHKTTMPIEAIEIQSKLVDMARRSVQYNKREEQICIHEMDIKDVKQHFTPSQFNVVTCNPPYFRANQNYQHLKEAHRIARTELMCTFEDCVAAANHLLKQGGKMVVVQRADRLVDVLYAMRLKGIEPKVIYPVYSSPKKSQAITVIVEGIKGGKPDVKVMSPFYIYDINHEYSQEMQEVYYG